MKFLLRPLRQDSKIVLKKYSFNCKDMLVNCPGSVNNQTNDTVLCDVITSFVLMITTSCSTASTCCMPSKKPCFLTSNSQKDCIDLKEIVQDDQKPKVETMKPGDSIENVCQHTKCKPNQICLPNHFCNRNDCAPYRCVDSCPIGTADEYHVPRNSWAKIPITDSFQLNTSIWNDCFEQCHCQTDGKLVDCFFHCFYKNPIAFNQISLDSV